MVIDYFWGYPWVPYFQTTANDKNRGFATSAGLIRCQSKKTPLPNDMQRKKRHGPKVTQATIRPIHLKIYSCLITWGGVWNRTIGHNPIKLHKNTGSWCVGMANVYPAKD